MKHDISYTEFGPNEVNSVRNTFEDHANSLGIYVDQLLWWNKKINLVSRDVPRETILNHVEHSLVVGQSDLFKKASNIIDTGTGGGLPGVPLAITTKDKEFLLNDIVSKKIMACKQMVLRVGLENVGYSIGSLEELDIKPGALVISKHAFKINEMFSMIGEKPWLGVILLKGRDSVERELKGIDEELRVKVFSLPENFNNPFYEGKSMIEIIRKGK